MQSGESRIQEPGRPMSQSSGNVLKNFANVATPTSSAGKRVGQTFLSVPGISVDLVLGREPVLRQQMSGDFAQVPDDAEPGEDFQCVVSDVDLPPEEALARRGHKVMMVVVPAFAEREQREQPVVLAGVSGFV